jgi:restriction system protein
MGNSLAQILGGWMPRSPRAWVVRAGPRGERESLALGQGLVLVSWGLQDRSDVKSRDELIKLLEAAYPNDARGRLINWAAQLWAFLDRIQLGDLVVLPLKLTPAIAIGQVSGAYSYRPDLPSDARHVRPVKWLSTNVPRAAVGQDLLYSLRVFLTVYELRRHQAPDRLAALAATAKDPRRSR